MALLFIVRTIMQAHKHRSPALCNATEGTVPEVENESDAQVLDRMCLALGVLTNLVQVLDTAKDMLRKICTWPLYFLFFMFFIMHIQGLIRSASASKPAYYCANVHDVQALLTVSLAFMCN